MDLSLIIFLCIVSYFIYKGYRNGILNITSRILSLASAYLAAFLFAKPLGHWIQENTSFEGLITYAMAGLFLFTLTSILLGIIFSKILTAASNNDHPVSHISSIAGGLVGSLVGILIGLFFVWFFSVMQSIYQEKKNLPITQSSKFQQTAKDIAGSAVKSVVYGVTQQQDLADASAAILSNPAVNMKRFKNLNQSQVMREFFNNHQSQQALNSGNAKAVMNDPAFQKFVTQADFIELSKEFGFSKETGEMQKQMALRTTELWARINRVKTDPEYLALINSPEIQQIVNSSDVYALMSNSKVERMLEIISATEIPTVRFDDIDIVVESQSEKAKTQKPQALSSKIYRWVDDKEQVHYSDKKNDNSD